MSYFDLPVGMAHNKTMKTGHSVVTVPQRKWAGIKNGELLSLAEKEFDVFLL